MSTRLMNGFTAVAESTTDSVVGWMLHIGMMMISNRAILAILTSMVRHNMISSFTRRLSFYYNVMRFSSIHVI